MNLWMLAFIAASIISDIGTSRELSPYAIFSLILRSKSIGSWDTIPIWPLSQAIFKSDRLRPWRVYKIKWKSSVQCSFIWHAKNMQIWNNPQTKTKPDQKWILQGHSPLCGKKFLRWFSTLNWPHLPTGHSVYAIYNPYCFGKDAPYLTHYWLEW